MNRNDTAPNVGRLFFPQSQSLGVDQGSYSPHVLRQIVYAGVQNTSFTAGRDDLLNLARLKISEKQVERATERIGQERVEQRGAQVQAFLKLPVMEKFAAAVAHPPDLAVVEMDGGRLQIRNEKRSDPTITGVASPVEEVGLAVEATPGQAVAGPSASETRNHWREDKIGLLMTMTSKESAGDPCPTIPETFVNPLRIIKLARELHKGCAPSEGAVADPSDPEKDNPLECPEYIPPTVLVKSMVATRQDAESLGKTLAAAARSRGFYGAKRKAFVADGAECNWTVQKRWFSDFVPIIDFIHALSHEGAWGQTEFQVNLKLGLTPRSRTPRSRS